MSLYNTIKWLLGKIPPNLWPWNKDASAKHLVWTIHVLIVAFSVGFAGWLLYALFFGAPEVVPDASGAGIDPQAQPPPLPMWVRVMKSLAPMLAPFVSYALWRYLPEPNGDK